MKLQFVSDLHLDTHNDQGDAFLEIFGNEHGADVLVIAGDLCEARHQDVLNRALSLFALQWKDVIYVPGNHEFWGSSYVNAMNLLKAAVGGHSNVHLLDNRAITIEDVRIFGGTGWYLEPRTSADIHTWKGFSDSHRIANCEPAIFESRSTFEAGMYGDTEGSYDVIVSHHLPDQKCIAKQWRGHPVNRFFVADLDVKNAGAALWIHGHTHDQVNVKIGQTQVLANPLGYPGEASNRTFVSNYVIEI